MDKNSQPIELPTEDVQNTSTMCLARELHRSSWKWNIGRTVHDLPLFDSLGELAQFHLLDTAAAAQKLLNAFPDESGQLLTWNCAEALYLAYHAHPADKTPHGSWDDAPKEMKLLWYRYAEDFITEYYRVRGLPAYNGWMDVRIKKL